MGELWTWVNVIYKTPSFVKTLAEHELELLEIELQKQIREERWTIEKVEAANPGHKLSSPDLEKWEAVLGRVVAELKRRRKPVTVTERTKEREKLTQEKLALFYRAIQQAEAYPSFSNKGKECKEIVERHGIKSADNFRQHYNSLKALPFEEMVERLSVDLVSELIDKLPNNENARDLLRVYKAKE